MCCCALLFANGGGWCSIRHHFRERGLSHFLKKGRKKCQIRQILFFALLLCAHMAVASRVEVSQYDASSSRSIHRKSAMKRGRENNPPTLLFPLRFVVGTKRAPGFRKWRDRLFPFSRIRPPFLFSLHPEKRKSQGCQRCDEMAFSIFYTARQFSSNRKCSCTFYRF